MTANKVMTAKPRTIAPEALAETAVAQMAGKMTCLFVTEGGQPGVPRGIIHIHDCLRAGVV